MERKRRGLTSQLCDSKPITKLLLVKAASFGERVRRLKVPHRS